MSNEEAIYDCVQKNFETDEEYKFRKEIYDKVFQDTQNKKNALIYSNMWVNILSMQCEYPKEIMENIEKYKPINNIYKI